MPFIKNKKKPKKEQTRFTNKKPFDCFWICFGVAYVVIWFYVPRQRPREMFWITIDKFIAEKNRCETIGRKSLKKEEWRKIAEHVYEF